MSHVDGLKPLEPWQREKFGEILKFADARCRRYGNPSNKRILRNKEKPCKRVKKSAGKGVKFPIRNNITEFPKKLEIYHIALMYHFNVQLDENSQSEIRHRCVDPNPKKKHRKNLCFEETHLGLGPHENNIEDKSCHRVIRNFQSKYSNNPKYRTLGTIYVSDVPVECREDHFKDLVCNHNCFGNYGEIKLSE